MPNSSSLSSVSKAMAPPFLSQSTPMKNNLHWSDFFRVRATSAGGGLSTFAPKGTAYTFSCELSCKQFGTFSGNKEAVIIHEILLKQELCGLIEDPSKQKLGKMHWLDICYIPTVLFQNLSHISICNIPRRKLIHQSKRRQKADFQTSI